MANPKSYEALRKIWYKKLAKSGFDDQETSDQKFWTETSKFRRDVSWHSWQAKQEYYTMAEHFLNDHIFDNELDKTVWEYHTNGVSVRNIAKLLAKVGIKRKKKDTILAIVKRIRDIMMAKYRVSR